MSKIKEKEKEIAFFLDPTPGRIIVVEDEFKEQSRIITPDSAKRRPTTGKVVSVGEDVGKYEEIFEKVEDDLVPKMIFKPRFHVGERVVYGLYSGTVINFRGQPAFRILGQDEVLAIVRGADLILEGVGV